MCNIAGYVGKRPAAPILIDMIRRQEGFDGGYYTGIATLHEGKIYYAKLTGDTARLLEETDAARLPGCMGIIHSRTPSGGGDRWAHPFLGFGTDGTPVTAYVANGSGGCFSHRNGAYSKIAAALIASGVVLSSRDRVEDVSDQALPDGSAVHMSDVMCALATGRVARGQAPDAALCESFLEMPSEIVGLLLSLSSPDSIAFSRINMPMHAATVSHGTYLATTAMAFPADAGEVTVLPPCSFGRVLCDRVEINRMETPPATVAPIDERVRAAARETILGGLAAGDATFDGLRRSIKPHFAPADANQSGLLTYEILGALQKEGALVQKTVCRPGAAKDLTAPEFRLSLCKTDTVL